MRKKLDYLEIRKLKVIGPIYKKHISIPTQSNQGITTSEVKMSSFDLYFFMRADGALIYSNQGNNNSVRKENTYIFKFKKKMVIRIRGYNHELNLYRKKTPNGLAIYAKVYKYNGSYYHRLEHLKHDFEFLNPLDVKLIRAGRDSWRRKSKQSEGEVNNAREKV
jgi:hypothetical protein